MPITPLLKDDPEVPPSGGSLEIGNSLSSCTLYVLRAYEVPPSGGSLEIGNYFSTYEYSFLLIFMVPPSGGSLEIGNSLRLAYTAALIRFPLRGDP